MILLAQLRNADIDSLITAEHCLDCSAAPAGKCGISWYRQTVPGARSGRPSLTSARGVAELPGPGAGRTQGLLMRLSGSAQNRSVKVLTCELGLLYWLSGSGGGFAKVFGSGVVVS